MTPVPGAPQPNHLETPETSVQDASEQLGLNGLADIDFLQAAATQLREEPVEGWTEISASIRQRLKSVVRRSRPVQAATDSGRKMYVADGVIVAYLRQAIDAIEDCELDQVGLVGEDDTCTGASIYVVSRYGHDYQALADHVRSVAYDVFRILLGPTDPPFGIEGVDVTVTDLTDDEYR